MLNSNEKNFNELGISKAIIGCLDKLKITIPTKIQQETIPLALAGKDILASSQTGTGKTLAFLLPIITKLIQNKDEKCLIVEPTRELAQQLLNNVKNILNKKLFIRYILLIGGESYFKQNKELKCNPTIIIGTPGRIIDHLHRETLNLQKCKYLVLDETDRMFDMGFYEQLEEIFKYVPQERQTLMFSATFPREIENLAVKHLKTPEKIFVQTKNQPNTVADNLEQKVIEIKQNEKYQELLKQLKICEGTVIVFMQRKIDVDYYFKQLIAEGFKVCMIHGDLRQRIRERTIKDFRSGKYRILVGTDVVARGLDVPHVKYVINYDLPEDPEEYIHRIGRTARAGKSGTAITFLTEKNKNLWNNIQELLHPELKKNLVNSYKEKRRPRKRKTFNYRKRTYHENKNLK